MERIRLKKMQIFNDYIYYNKLVYKHVKRKVSGYFQWLVNRWMIQSEEKYF